MSKIKFCDACDNIMYKQIDEKNKLFDVCKVCLNFEESKDELDSLYENKKKINLEEIINKNKFILEDNTLSVIENPINIICPNIDCKTNTENESFSLISLKYDLSNLKFIYKCKTCNQSWLNK